MSEMGFESSAPSEDGGNAAEGISEQAKAKFAAGQAAAQQIKKEEKKAKKKDDGVAQVILQFLTDTQKAHLATLISRLVATDCPSPFILAILSLINKECLSITEEYLREQGAAEIDMSSLPVPQSQGLTDEYNQALAAWNVRRSQDPGSNIAVIIKSLLVEDGNIDGTVLQVTTFVMQEFLEAHGKKPDFEEMQKLSIGILQSVFTPFMEQGHLEEAAAETESE